MIPRRQNLSTPAHKAPNVIKKRMQKTILKDDFAEYKFQIITTCSEEQQQDQLLFFYLFRIYLPLCQYQYFWKYKSLSQVTFGNTMI